MMNGAYSHKLLFIHALLHTHNPSQEINAYINACSNGFFVYD